MKICLTVALATLLTLCACSSTEDGSAPPEAAAATATAEAAIPGGPRPAPEFAFPGFEVYESDGRLWVFREGSEGHLEFERVGEPSESVTMVGAGPAGMTIKSDHRETLVAYTSTKPGFRVFEIDGRLWVFREGSQALADYMAGGVPAESATRVGAGPRRETVRSQDLETIEAYLAAWR